MDKSYIPAADFTISARIFSCSARLRDTHTGISEVLFSRYACTSASVARIFKDATPLNLAVISGMKLKVAKNCVFG